MNFKCILKSFSDACDYNISVMATNAVGSAQSLIYLPYISISSVTPKPPENFSVERTDKEGELRVRWKARPTWDLANQNYAVLYHAKGEIKNRTSTRSNKEFTLLTGLKDFTEYYVYVVVRFDESAWSEAIGPKIVRTKAGSSFVTIEPGSPDNSYFVLRGSVFLLNCTVRSGFGQSPNVSWKHNDKWLFDRAKKIDDSTVQLQLLNASAHDNGIYWCGPVSGDKSQGVNISVTVADPPSSPRNLNLKIYGVYPFIDVWILWSSSSYTGGLPVNYSIKLCNDKPDNPCQKTACRLINIKECQPVNILSTTMNFKCILKTFLDACVYNISVMATNAVGGAQSLIYLPFISISSVTPKPPENFSVEHTDKEGELCVRWKARLSWDLADQNYTVLYHAKGEIKNRTSTTSNKEFTLLTGLKDFTEYYVYVVVRLDESAWSEAIGPKIVRTKAGYPVNLPKVIRDYSISFPGNSGLRNVSVEWEPADTSSWRGNPGQYVISCAYHVGQREVKGCSYTTDAKATSITLPRLENAHSYDVFMIMRNMEGKSSTRRLFHVIKKVQETQTTTTQERKLSSVEIAGLTISVLVGCTIAGVAVYFVRKWGRRQTPLMPLKDIQLEPPPVEYDYIAEADSKDANGDYSQLYDK